MILLAQESGTMSPLAIFWIVVFALVIAVGVIYDRKKAKKFKEQMEQDFQQKRIDGDEKTFITSDHELVIKVEAATYSEYNFFKLDNVSYVFTAKDKNTQMWQFGLYDPDQKLISGTRIKSGNQKLQKQNGYILSNHEALDAVELVKKYVPNVKHVGRYFKEKA